MIELVTHECAQSLDKIAVLGRTPGYYALVSNNRAMLWALYRRGARDFSFERLDSDECRQLTKATQQQLHMMTRREGRLQAIAKTATAEELRWLIAGEKKDRTYKHTYTEIQKAVPVALTRVEEIFKLFMQFVMDAAG